MFTINIFGWNVRLVAYLGEPGVSQISRPGHHLGIPLARDIQCLLYIVRPPGNPLTNAIHYGSRRRRLGISECKIVSNLGQGDRIGELRMGLGGWCAWIGRQQIDGDGTLVIMRKGSEERMFDSSISLMSSGSGLVRISRPHTCDFRAANWSIGRRPLLAWRTGCRLGISWHLLAAGSTCGRLGC